MVQYTCQYDAVKRTVACQPFVRTFLKTAAVRGKIPVTEITSAVGSGLSRKEHIILDDMFVTIPLFPSL